MAKLGNYYGLCPLIDHKSLLGVSEDTESGHVIVTLGKNICIKYRLSDQKQIHSWRTKDKFSSPVIYDHDTSKYVAVFNNSYVRVWNVGEENIDKLKKHKFTKSIYTLVQCDKKSFIVFKDGIVSELNKALEDRKEYDNNELLDDVIINDILICKKGNEIYIGIVYEHSERIIFDWSIFSNDSVKHGTKETLSPKNNRKLMGQVLCYLIIEKNVQLLTLWSDGSMYAYPLISTSEDKQNESHPPGNRFSIVQSLSLDQPVTMTTLNEHYIALYGADCSQEGAILLLYNTQFKITQSRLSFKMFTSEAKLWRVENNLLLSMGHHLAVIPYYLHVEKLASLIGSHTLPANNSSNSIDSDVAIINKVHVFNWNKNENPQTDEDNEDLVDENIPLSIKSKIIELLQQGKPEKMICSELVPQFIEDKNIEAILDVLNYFTDVPEDILLQLLQFSLCVDSKYFKDTTHKKNLNKQLQPAGRCDLLDKILSVRFNDILLLPYLRRDLDLDSSLLVLSYIQYIFSEDNRCLPDTDCVETEKKLIDWSTVLLDAKYQSLILSKDEKIAELLNSFSELVHGHLRCLKDMNRVFPELIQLTKGMSSKKKVHKTNLFYSIEKMSLY